MFGNLIQADAQRLLRTPRLGLVGVYRDYQVATFTPSTGAYTPSYVEISLPMIQNTLPAREVAARPGLYQTGNIRVAVARTLLTVIPNKEDLIVLAGVTYNVISWDSDPLNLLWRIVASRANVTLAEDL